MKAPAVLRIVRARPRLFICAAVGLVVSILVAFLTSWRPATRLLAGWDTGAALYLVLVFHMMRRSDVHRIRLRAAEQDEGQVTILVLTVAAALTSVAAIFAQLGSSAAADRGRPLTDMALPAFTILLSWVFIHTIRPALASPFPVMIGSPTTGTSSIFLSSSA